MFPLLSYYLLLYSYVVPALILSFSFVVAASLKSHELTQVMSCGPLLCVVVGVYGELWSPTNLTTESKVVQHAPT